MTERELSRAAARRLAIIRHAQEVTGNVALDVPVLGGTHRRADRGRRPAGRGSAADRRGSQTSPASPLTSYTGVGGGGVADAGCLREQEVPDCL